MNVPLLASFVVSDSVRRRTGSGMRLEERRDKLGFDRLWHSVSPNKVVRMKFAFDCLQPQFVSGERAVANAIPLKEPVLGHAFAPLRQHLKRERSRRPDSEFADSPKLLRIDERVLMEGLRPLMGWERHVR